MEAKAAATQDVATKLDVRVDYRCQRALAIDPAPLPENSEHLRNEYLKSLVT